MTERNASAAAMAKPGCPPLLMAQDLSAGYGDNDILHGLSLRVDAGELVAVIGPNGAGKSTLLKTLAGLVRPRGGRIALDGTDITGASTQRIVAAGLCYVPQEANVFASLSVWENLTIGAWTAPSALNARARAVVELFPVLDQRRRARAGTLSGGERQMLAMAMALMVEPRLLLLDEPSAGLAPALQRLVFDRIRDINARGLGILLVEQNAHESLALCQRAYVLAMGRVRAEGPGDVLRNDPEIRRLYLGG
jgi:ABC-type branched-subunit amino acid transport system ATPase component